MGLLFEEYAFEGTAPSHERVWEVLCEVTGREVQREVYIAPDEFVGSDWKAAEQRGCSLLAAKRTTFTDGKRRVWINTLVRGDKIFAELDHDKSPLTAALREAMTRLGGRVDRGEGGKSSRQRSQ